MPNAASSITRSSLRDQVLTVLRQRLVSGEFMPGEIYSAQVVAAELGVSGSPVREAMLTLVTQGLMEPIRNRGFMVVAMSDKDRLGIFQMRLWLEVPAMKSLALRAELLRPHELRFHLLADQIVDAARVGNVADFLDLDRQFHLGLIELLENIRLTTVVGELRDQTRLFGLEQLKRDGSLVSSAEEHLHILDALTRGDESTTQELMASHIGHVVKEWAGGVGIPFPSAIVPSR